MPKEKEAFKSTPYDGVMETTEAGIGETAEAGIGDADGPGDGGWLGGGGGSGWGGDGGWPGGGTGGGPGEGGGLRGTAGGRGSARGAERAADSWRLVRGAATAIALLAAATFGAMLLFGYVWFRPAVLAFGAGDRDPSSIQRIQQVWDTLVNDFYMPVDQDRMIERAAAAMASAVDDVYTTYYTKEEMQRFTERTSGHYTGIGVYVANGENGRLYVTGMFEGSAAAEAGVLAGDEIVGIDGASVEGIADSDEIVSMIRGEEGTSVRIRFYRPSASDYVEFEITRRDVKIKNVEAALIHAGARGGEDGGAVDGSGDDGGAVDGGAEDGGADAAGALPNGIKEIWDPEIGAMVGDIGYIRLLMFDGDASKDFDSYLDDLLAAGAAGIVIDLRDNPGGSFDECLKIASRLIGEGAIVTVESRNGAKVHSADARKIEAPFKILVNENSASASEIVAGAVKDHGAGRLFGARTYGKGLVQNVIPLPGGAGLKYTQSVYYMPNGESIHEKGVEPDIAVETPDEYKGMPAAAVPYAEDLQLKAAILDFPEDFSQVAAASGP